MKIFGKRDDYAAFEWVLEEAYLRESLRILAYCVMPNHWHIVVWPKRGADKQVSEFFRWLTVTHTQRWHVYYKDSRPLFFPGLGGGGGGLTLMSMVFSSTSSAGGSGVPSPPKQSSLPSTVVR